MPVRPPVLPPPPPPQAPPPPPRSGGSICCGASGLGTVMETEVSSRALAEPPTDGLLVMPRQPLLAPTSTMEFLPTQFLPSTQSPTKTRRSAFGVPEHIQPQQAQSSDGPEPQASLPAGWEGSAEHVSLQWQWPIPDAMPWVTQTAAPVSFTASHPRETHCQSGLKSGGVIRLKRRKAVEEEATRCKQALTEEMMAAKLSSLSLNNDHVYGSNGFPARRDTQERDSKYRQWEEAYRRFCELEGRLEEEEEDGEKTGVFEEGVYDMSDNPIITLSCTLKEQLRNTMTDAITQLTIDSIRRPCMELVVWHPPDTMLRETLRAIESDSRSPTPVPGPATPSSRATTSSAKLLPSVDEGEVEPSCENVLVETALNAAARPRTLLTEEDMEL
ncbi:coiled-coil domain-containing protein 117 isoform X1 [Petromyzon marinus]|uniref:coiled-coil domain-containing protein 117 isoform X1 n=1 Tax=Petromyzon marinus TaxID=7757 RepID=UPI003F72877B